MDEYFEYFKCDGCERIFDFASHHIAKEVFILDNKVEFIKDFCLLCPECFDKIAGGKEKESDPGATIDDR